MSGQVDQSEVSAAVAAFRSRLADSEAMSIVRETITHGPSFVVSATQFVAMREHLATHLSLSANRDVFMVGSAKLGFSIKTKRRWLAFNDDSDVDLAVVSPALYETVWSEVRRFQRGGGLWPSEDQRSHFKNDHVHGVIKPHVILGISDTAKHLFDIQTGMRRLGLSDYPVTLAVWHSMDALEEYQVLNVRQCQEELGL